jgi:hypothetical protein
LPKIATGAALDESAACHRVDGARSAALAAVDLVHAVVNADCLES